MIDLQEKMTP